MKTEMCGDDILFVSFQRPSGAHLSFISQPVVCTTGYFPSALWAAAGTEPDGPSPKRTLLNCRSTKDLKVPRTVRNREDALADTRGPNRTGFACATRKSR